MAFYRFVSRLHAMACLPLWHREATAEEKADVEGTHREFVAQYVG